MLKLYRFFFFNTKKINKSISLFIYTIKRLQISFIFLAKLFDFDLNFTLCKIELKNKKYCLVKIINCTFCKTKYKKQSNKTHKNLFVLCTFCLPKSFLALQTNLNVLQNLYLTFKKQMLTFFENTTPIQIRLYKGEKALYFTCKKTFQPQ